jgi:hypothetical protein
VVLAGQLLADRALHKTRQRRQYVDGRIDLTVVELAVDEDLALGDVACQVGNRVGDVCGRMTLSGGANWNRVAPTIVRHGQNGNLGDGAVATLDTARTFVNCRQIRVHVAGVSTTTWHLLSSCGDLELNILASPMQ